MKWSKPFKRNSIIFEGYFNKPTLTMHIVVTYLMNVVQGPINQRKSQENSLLTHNSDPRAIGESDKCEYSGCKWQMQAFCSKCDINLCNTLNNKYSIVSLVLAKNCLFQFRVHIQYPTKLYKTTSNNSKSNFHLYGVTEMEPKYTVSARGKILLLHDGYRYAKKCASGSKMRWRCTFSIRNRYVCTAKAWTFERNGVERVTFDGIHQHIKIINVGTICQDMKN